MGERGGQKVNAQNCRDLGDTVVYIHQSLLLVIKYVMPVDCVLVHALKATRTRSPARITVSTMIDAVSSSAERIRPMRRRNRRDQASGPAVLVTLSRDRCSSPLESRQKLIVRHQG